MQKPNNAFFKFMKDIISSGAWAQLSSAARTLYPVLCQFSDENFKHVWPGTETLLRLTGFKTKKSLQQAKKDLVAAGLIDVIAGSGRTPSRYYFRFDHKDSAITAHRDTSIPPTGIQESPSGGTHSAHRGDTTVPPNHININITNNSETQTNLLSEVKNLLENFVKDQPSSDDLKSQITDSLVQKYGQLETGEAIRIAIQRGKDGDIRYLEGILKNRQKDSSQRRSNKSLKNVENIAERLSTIAKNSALESQINSLKFQYFYNDVYYFTTKIPVHIESVRATLQEQGINCKILCRAKGA